MKKLWIACLSICVLIAGCSVKNDNKTIKLMEPISSSYNTTVVTRNEIYSLEQYQAYVTPYTEELSFTESGIIDTIKVTEGDKVDKGQVLATLDECSLKSQIEELKASIDNLKKNNEFSNTSAQYDIDILKLELDELGKEYKTTTDRTTKKALKISIDIKKADITIAEEKLAQAEQLQEYNLQKQEQDLEDLSQMVKESSIKAPFSGEIVYIAEVISGMTVGVNVPLIVIADTTKLLLKSEFISEDILKKCSRYYALYNNKEYKISYVPMGISQYLKSILSGSNPTTSFLLKNEDSSLSAGTYTSICIMSNYKPDVLTIPSETVYTDTEGKYVYLIDGDSKIRQSIEVGIVAGNMVEAVSGLEEGDRVYVKN